MEWVEGPTKTRQGGLKKLDRRLPQKLFATKDARCPITFLKQLVSKRLPGLKDCGPLYLRPLAKLQGNLWYSAQPVGIHKINSYMKEIAKLGGLDGTNKRFTNHSIRKTTVQKLQKAGISNDKIVAVTGHCNEQSLRDYASADMDDHRHISAILSRPERNPLLEVSSISPAQHQVVHPQIPQID